MMKPNHNASPVALAPAPVAPVTSPPTKDSAMDNPDLKAQMDELLALRAENAKLKAQTSRKLGMGITEKGGLSVYGIGSFPTTLYKSQWLALLDAADDIRALLATAEAAGQLSEGKGNPPKHPVVKPVKDAKKAA